MSARSPTLKRILKEASELASQPSSDYHAAPLESDLYEWHFTLRGPPGPSPFAGGIYHGRIILPPAYPLKPPSFRFLTATGRFEVNREICLSISGHHEETWQPAWGIRTALVAIRSFMDTAAGGQVGGMEASEGVRVRMAGQSERWKCAACGKSNGEIMAEQDKVVEELGGEGVKAEEVPAELRMAYREDLAKQENSGKAAATATHSTDRVVSSSNETLAADDQPLVAQLATPAAVDVTPPQQLPQTQTHTRYNPAVGADVPGWIDKAIFGVAAALVIMIFKMWMTQIG